MTAAAAVRGGDSMHDTRSPWLHGRHSFSLSDRTGRTEIEGLTPGEEALWQSMIRIVKFLPRQLDSDLRRAANMTIAEYDALRRLSQAPDRQLRMGELAREVGLSASRTTRLVQTLQARGFVTKITSSTDARGSLARLTSSGSAKVTSAWPTYVESLRSRLFDHLEFSTIDQLARALAVVVGRYDSDELPPEGKSRAPREGTHQSVPMQPEP